MTNVKAINDERFGRWKIQLNRKEATPILMVAVGHNHNSGQITVLTTEDRSDGELILLLSEAIRQLQESNN